MQELKESSCRICKDMFIYSFKIFCRQTKKVIPVMQEVPSNCATMRTYRAEEKRKNRYSRIYIPVGPSGVGKTTLRNLYLKNEPNLKVISPDDIREELLDYKNTGKYFDIEIEDQVWKTAYNQIIKYVNSNQPIFFDATNLTHEERRSIKGLVGPNYIAIMFIFLTSLDEVLERNRKRVKKVPEEIIIQQFTKRELPSFDEGYLSFVGDYSW